MQSSRHTPCAVQQPKTSKETAHGVCLLPLNQIQFIMTICQLEMVLFYKERDLFLAANKRVIVPSFDCGTVVSDVFSLVNCSFESIVSRFA